MSRVQCLSGLAAVGGNFELKNGFISRTRMPRVPACFGHFGPKIPGKMISLDIHLHNTGVWPMGQMQFRLARDPSTTRSRPFAHRPALATPRSRPFAHAARSSSLSPRRPPGARCIQLETFCAAPGTRSRSPPEPAASSSRPFAQRPMLPGARSGLFVDVRGQFRPFRSRFAHSRLRCS